jgi:hypothetical protein
MVSFHILKFEIEEEFDEVYENHNGLGPDNDNKRKFFWQKKDSLDPPFHSNNLKILNKTSQVRKEE